MPSAFTGKFTTTTTIFKSAWVTPRPFLLYFKPTAFCDLRCKICDRWKTSYDRQAEEMGLDEIEEMLRRFRVAGASILTLWGGEPTLRKDLPEILAAAKALGYRTALCSNGRLLSRKLDQVMPNLDTLLVSLDGVGQVHDQARGVDGLFETVVGCIKGARAYPKKRVKIWATVNNGNMHQIEALAELARDLEVGIEYFPVSPVPGYNNATVCDAAALEDAFSCIADLKKRGFPVWNPDRVLGIMGRSEPFKCNFGRIAVQVDHRGEIHSCEEPSGQALHPLGNYRDTDLEQLFASDRYKACVGELSTCNRCRLPCVVELSGNLPWALAGMFGRALYR